MSDDLITELKKLAIKRQRPLLVLDIKEMNAYLPLRVDKVLAGRKFASIDIVLQTGGGDIDAAYKAIRLVRNLADDVSILIPFFAKSAGTLMCLAADRLIMNDMSELGPLDTQVAEREEGEQRYKSALNETRALEEVRRHNIEMLDLCTQLLLVRCEMKITEAVQFAAQFAGQTSAVLYQKLDPKRTGEYQRALQIGQQYGVQLLTRYMGWDESAAANVVQTLVESYPSHSYVLDWEELQRLGLPVELADDDLNKSMINVRNLLLDSQKSIIELIEPSKQGTLKKLVKRGKNEQQDKHVEDN